MNLPVSAIRILDEETVNLIAAGEVVERPASIVKELIENAIDAGASVITVDVGTGRKEISRIRITDNGSGIRSGEVVLAFAPHATSKIRIADDLHSCYTLGFRGEALASIAAIAYVTLITRHRDEGAGTRLIISGGEILEQGEIGSPVGTTLTVEEIFFNTPARRKFLRRLGTELSRISGVVEVFSLMYPTLTFRYLLNGMERSASHGGRTLGEVLRAIRPDEADRMVPITWDEGGITIEGYLSLPSLTRQNPARILLAVNGRLISSSRISGAVRAGYGTLIPSHTFPAAVLKISLDPARIDANIHPTKREIRIADEHEFLRIISSAVSTTMKSSDLSRQDSSPDTTMQDLILDQPPVRDTPYTYPLPDTGTGRVSEATLAGYRATARQLRQTRLVQDASDERGNGRFPLFTYIGQVAATYLLATNESGDLILIDQHAAHERVRYDQLKKEQENGPASQELIVPVVLPVSQTEADILSDIRPLLEEEGFLLEPFGKGTWCVRGVPVVLGRCEDPQAIREIIISTIGSHNTHSEDRLRESVSRLAACRGAVKAGVVLTPEQGGEIIRQLSRTSEPYTCPHGRPTIVSITRTRLEELFMRR